MVSVYLYGKLRRFAEKQNPMGESVIYISVQDGDSIGDIVRKIGIRHEKLGSNIFLNGEYSSLTRKVKSGDRLGLFPNDMQLLYKWYFRKVGDDERDDRG